MLNEGVAKHSRRWYYILPIVLCGIVVSFSSPWARAQENKGGDKILIKPQEAPANPVQGPIVKEIEIQYAGPRSVDRSVILSNMRTTEGQAFSLLAVEEDVHNLYATGLFVNLRIYDEPMADGVKVIVAVQPKPLVKEVLVIGAEKINEKAIRKKIGSKPGEPLSEQRVSSDAQDIKDYYLDKAFDQVQVEYKIDVNDQIGRATITYTIREGDKAFVKEILFEGNKAISAKDLKKAMKTKEENWLSWFNKSGRLKMDQLNADLKELKSFYQSKGYIDAVVENQEIERVDSESIIIKIKIFEGIQYKVGSIKLQDHELFDRNSILAILKMKEEDIFSPGGLEADVKAIRDLYGQKGYTDTVVIPKRQPNIQNGRMDLNFQIREGSQSFVEKIIIQGNNTTKDKVLRRELALAPGDVYDTVRAEASKKRLENLGYFSKVDVNEQDTNVPNRKNMSVTVEEQRTGSVTFGAGFSTVDSLLGFVELQQGNFDIANFPRFTGGGQKFRAKAQWGLRRRDFTLSWTEPWFMNRQLSLGFDLFYNVSDFVSSTYDISRMGGSVRLGKALNQFWSVGLRYQFENIDIFDVDSGAPIGIQSERGARTKSSVQATVTYDTRDSVTLARHGERIIMSAEGAGGPLLGQTDTWKLELNATKFVLLPYDIILSQHIGAGVTDEFDDTDQVPLFDRFFLGGPRTVRGFDFRDVGPRFPGSSEPAGGRTMAFAQTELTFPIMSRVRGATFFDAGFVNNDAWDFSLDGIQAGTGVGLRLDLPIGPLRLDIGFPVIYDDVNDNDFRFHFDVGYQF